jgi:hypothetical protein
VHGVPQVLQTVDICREAWRLLWELQSSSTRKHQNYAEICESVAIHSSTGSLLGSRLWSCMRVSARQMPWNSYSSLASNDVNLVSMHLLVFVLHNCCLDRSLRHDGCMCRWSLVA